MPLNWMSFYQRQVNVFREARRQDLPAFDYPILRISTTRSISRLPEAQFDMVRLGIGLYGISPILRTPQNLQNVSTLKSKLSRSRGSGKRTGGYNRAWSTNEAYPRDRTDRLADGLSRRLSNDRGHVMVNGQRVPIVGNVCMDMCMVKSHRRSGREGDDEDDLRRDGMPSTTLAEEMDSSLTKSSPHLRRVKRIYFAEGH
jgi:alanine racemase